MFTETWQRPVYCQCSYELFYFFQDLYHSLSEKGRQRKQKVENCILSTYTIEILRHSGARFFPRMTLTVAIIRAISFLYCCILSTLQSRMLW